MIIITNFGNKHTVYYNSIHINDIGLISSDLQEVLNPNLSEQMKEEIFQRVEKELTTISFSEQTDLSTIMIYTDNFEDYKNAIKIMSFNMGAMFFYDRIYVKHYIQNNILYIQTKMINS